MKNALGRFLDDTGTAARIKLFTCADKVHEWTPWTVDRQLLHEAIDRVTTEGGTALREGVHVAAKQLAASSKDTRTLIVCTDGRDTVGGPSLETLVALCRAQRISVHCVGFESGDIDRAFLESLASQTGGTYSLANKPDEMVSHVAAISRRLGGHVYRIAILDPDAKANDLRVEIGAERQLVLPVSLTTRIAAGAVSALPETTRVSQVPR